MRILIPSSGAFDSEYGGGQVYVRAIAQALVQNGHEVVVVWFQPEDAHSNGSASDILHHGPIVEERIRVSTTVAANVPLELSPGALQAARETLDRYQPDIVHANGSKASFARVCYERGIPCVITAHHGGIVCPAGTLLDWNDCLCERPIESRTCASCCRRGLPAGIFVDAVTHLLPRTVINHLDRVLSTSRNVPFLTPAVRMTTAPERMRQSVEALSLPGNQMVAPSRAIAKALVRNGIPASQVVVIPHGIPPISRRPLRRGLGQRPVRLLFVGRISRVKGLHVLFEALRSIPSEEPWELHIVGQAVTKAERRYGKRLLASQPNISPVMWLGQLDHDGVCNELAECDVLVLPSIYLEVFGLVILEAFSTGRPVITTRSGGPEELVRHGVDGLVVRSNDSTELAAALRLMIQNPAEVERMANNIGPVRTIEEHILDLEALYSTAMARRCYATVSSRP